MYHYYLMFLRPILLGILSSVLVSCGEQTENERASRDVAVMQVETLIAAPEAY